jgi:glycosyltransferase involved in cell wall biosynthesis
VIGKPTLSLVLPARDEARNIAASLERARAVLGRLTKEYEILVVDDGSRDATAEIAARFPEARLLRHPRGRGYGAALRTGLAAARMDWIAFTDADLQFELAELERLFAVAGDADLVIGVRAPRRDPLRRRLLGRGWNALVRAALGLAVVDVNCAFKLLRRAAVADLELRSSGAAINAELLARAAARGLRLREVPVSHFPRRAGRASGARPAVIARALVELASLWRELR